MAKQSTFGNMVLSLTLICLVCSALLGVVYSITAEPIAKAELDKVNSAIAAVVPEFDNVPSEDVITLGESTVYLAKKADQIAGYAVKVKTSGFGGPLQMMVGFQPDGTIYNTSVISHSETPGLGAKITDENIQPRAQVKGRNPMTDAISVKKDGGEIDAITASTITSRAFLKGVNMAYEVFKQVSAPAASEQPAEEPLNTLSDEQQQ